MASGDFRPNRQGHRRRKPEETPMGAGARPYRRFERWMDRELARLVARWIHTAAPNSLRPSRFRLRNSG